MSLLRYKISAGIRAGPGSSKNYPKFLRVDNKPVSEETKFQKLNSLVREELLLLNMLASKYPGNPIIHRLQIRQLSSLLDSYLSALNYRSLKRYESGEIKISSGDLVSMKGGNGVLEFYKASLKAAAKAYKTTSPLGDRLQIAGALIFWPKLRGRITHPRSLEGYQLNFCDITILKAIGQWFDDLIVWHTEHEIELIDSTKREINARLDATRQFILSKSNTRNDR